MALDLTTDPLGEDDEGRPVYLRDIWPSEQEVAETIRAAVSSALFQERYASVFEGDERWQAVEVSGGQTFAWDPQSTYVLKPPFFDQGLELPPPPADIHAPGSSACSGTR